jgi:hypothetical protein
MMTYEQPRPRLGQDREMGVKKPVDPRAELLRQMAALRERIGPDVLKKGADAIQAKSEPKAEARPQQAAPGKKPLAPWLKPGEVPFDRENAAEGVRKFLESRQDGGSFLRRLTAKLKRSGN